MRTLRLRVWLLAIAATMCTAGVAQAQQSGTVFSQTLTVVKGAINPAFDFEIAGGNNGKSANSNTVVFVEFGEEGNATPPEPDPNLNTVLFKVSKGGVNGTSDFTTAGGVENVKFANKIVILTKGQENTGDPRGLYRLVITHLQGVAANTTESWKLEVTNIPASLRMIASIDQGAFKTLTPTGVCSGGTCPPCNCPSACPPGSHCQPWKPWPYWKYVKVVIWPKWPWPNPPCLSCPRPWDEPIPDGFDRVMVSLTPFVKEDAPLGPGRADNIKVNISGGQAIGPLFDTGSGEYLQMVQYRKGDTARVSASVGDVKSEEVVASAQGEGVNPIFRTLTYALIVLLLVALVAMWSLRRPRPALDRRA